MNTCDANSEDRKPDKRFWLYPPDRPWIEFIIVMALLASCMLSILKMTTSIYEVSRVNEAAAIEEKEFHKQVSQNMKTHIMLLKEISTQVGVPDHKANRILGEGLTR